MSKKTNKLKRKDIIYGIRPIIEAIEAGKTIDKIMLQKSSRGDLIRELSNKIRVNNIAVQYVPIERLNRIIQGNHQGAIAFISSIEYSDIFNVIPTIYEQGVNPFILILDRITDVRNFGAICRTAECAGVHAIVIPTQNSAQINEDAIKTSAGALNIIPICKHNNLFEVIEFIKNSGIDIIGITEKSNKLFYETDYNKPICLMVGNEGDGISDEYFKYFSDIVKIPMQGDIESLNVSVAAGIILFEAVKQRI